VSTTTQRGNGTPPILSVKDMHTYYGSIAAVKGISIEVHEGEIVTLIGSNGAGKSTTMRSISGIVPPRRGTITFQGKTISGMPGHKVTAAGISQSPEGRRIFGRMSVLENLELGAFLRDDKDGIKHDLEHVLDLFPRLKERLAQKAGTMSGGEQQMLAVARALMSKPKLLMLDEPSMGLAPVLVDLIFETIQRINAEGMTILMVEQNALAALEVANYAYVLESGTIKLQGPALELATNDEVRKAYLGES
jgi:branched-chain amino acid transport system ATP-binding protein